MVFQLKKKFIFTIIFLTILIIVNIFLQFIPLFNVLGYEISAINGIFLFYFGGIFSIHSHKKDKSQKLETSILQNIFVYLLLFFIPLIVSLISTFVFQRCPFFDGILFYFVITLPSLFIGIFIGGFITQIFKKIFYVSFTLLFLILCLIPAFEIYLFPQIYFYSPIIGFFSGTIYDEDITISGTLIFYRLLNIIFVLFLYYFSSYWNKQNKRLIIIIVSVFVAALLFLSKPRMGFSTTVSRLENELGGKIETEHFTTIYSKSIPYDDIVNLCLHQEFYYEDIKNVLNDEPHEKITSFIFRTGERKRELFGSNVANVAKPWSNQIYLNFDSYDQSLKHELVHIFSANYGYSIFKMSGGFNPAMLEGFAMAIENDYDDNIVHFIAAVAYHNGYKIQITDLFRGLNFFGNVSSLSYIYSGSFVRYLIDNYGVKKIKEVYGNLEFEKVYKKALDSLSNEYEKFISNMQVDTNFHLANLYFGRKSIFQKIHPRYTASRLNDANELYSISFFEEAFSIYDEIYNYTESYSSLIGKINCLVKLNKNYEAYSILKNEINKFDSSSYYYFLELLLGDICIRYKKFEEANSIYKILEEQNPNIFYLLNAKIKVHLFSIDTNLVFDYVEGSNFDKYNILRNLNKDDIFYFSIPAMVDLSGQLNESTEHLFNFFDGKIKVKDYLSSYAAFYLSKYAMKESKYDAALFYANEALKYYSNESFNEVLNYNLNKAKWFVYNSEKIRKDLKVIR